MDDAANLLGRWQPWNPHEVANFFAALKAPWWIASGWAIDLFLGRQTRKHEDIDILFLCRDQRAVRALLGTWDAQAALPPPRDERWPFRSWRPDDVLDETIHDVWCRLDATQPWAIQLMIDDTRGEQWLFRRMPDISRPIATIGGMTVEGVPYLAPEIQLLYKAKGLRPKDEADFLQALPQLSRERRIWLGDSLMRTHPRHSWLGQLTG